MPVKLRYDREKEILCVAVENPFKLEEFEAAVKDIIESDQFPPDIGAVWDLRELDFTVFDRSFEEELINIQKKYPERGEARLALVTPDGHGFGMMRMYEGLSYGLPQRIKVFKSYTEAEDWLLQP